jgi:hypothetical protein
MREEDRMVKLARARLRRAAACAVAAVAAAVIAGGCAAQHDTGGTPHPPGGGANSLSKAAADSPGSKAPARAARDARAAAPAARVPLTVPNSVTARKAVTLTGCTATSAGGLATGTVTGTRAATYTITVFFTTRGATVVGYATARVHAAPGKATPWRASGHFRAPHGMSCVLRGVTAR